MSFKPENIDVVILCGGKGTRLGTLTQETPKPLLQVGTHPFLFHVLQTLQKQGFRRFILAVHYLADQFKQFIDQYRDVFPDVTLVLEPEPMGTGGALRNAVTQVRSPIFVALNGDSFVPESFMAVVEQHQQKKVPFTMIAIRSEHVEGGTHNKGGMKINADKEVLAFLGHHSEGENWISAGMYVADRNAIMAWPLERYDLEKQLESLLKPAKPSAFLSEGYLLDIGTPDCFSAAQEKFKLFTNV